MSKSIPPLHERLAYDLENGQVLDGPRRYLLMRPDVLMGAFDGLPPDLRAQVLAELSKSVTRYGGKSVEAYLAEVGVNALLDVMVDNSASLGWGCWKFNLEAEGSLRLEVRNSPYAVATSNGQQVACYPIEGMFLAVARALWGQDVKVRETQCACQGLTPVGHCFFQASKGV